MIQWTFLVVLVVQWCIRCAAAANSTAVTFDEFLMNYFSPKAFNGSWISGTEIMYEDNGALKVYDVTTLSAKILVDMMPLNSANYRLMADRRHLLVGYDPRKIYRYSELRRYAVHDLVERITVPLAKKKLLRAVVLSPVESDLVYVLKNDLYYQKLGQRPCRLTFNGKLGVIFNGVPDWVYEEEVLHSAVAMSFSPDGSWLMFSSYNDSKVRSESIRLYGQPGKLASQYSKYVRFRYPKPGTRNPKVTLHAINLRQILCRNRPVEIVNLLAPIEAVTKDHILYRTGWINQKELYAVWTNRVQNLAVMVMCDVTSENCKEIFRWSENKGWVTPHTTIFDHRGRIATVLPQPQGDGIGNYEHITLINMKESPEQTMATATPITRGRSVVTALYGWDFANDVIYYQATPEDQPTQKQVYVQNVAHPSRRSPVCLSCRITSPEGNPCLYASASLSPDLSHMILECSGPDPTQVLLVRTLPAVETLALWEDNAELRASLREKSLPRCFSLRMSLDDGLYAPVRLWAPPEVDLSGKTKYPLLVYVYGAPNSNTITDHFEVNWGTYLVTSRNIIYAMIDGRGSGMMGDNMKFSTYRRLGTLEVYDQINITRMLHDIFPFIDDKRTGIWGWSYGGYATAMALAKDDEPVFECGISVAPATSWIYYDSVYTERYMGLPTREDNLDGYCHSDVTLQPYGFLNKSFYLIHGNADDNVHYLQAMMLSRSLQRNSILFKQQSYPDEAHDFHGVIPHLFLSMDQFWTECFGL